MVFLDFLDEFFMGLILVPGEGIVGFSEERVGGWRFMVDVVEVGVEVVGFVDVVVEPIKFVDAEFLELDVLVEFDLGG